MKLVVAFTVAVLFGAGAHLMRRGDIVKLVVGTSLLSNAAVLLLVSAGFGSDEAPILPEANPATVSDPLVQALALTAVVIAFGTIVLLLRIVLAVERHHDTVAQEDLVEAEVEEGEGASDDEVRPEAP